MKNNIAFTWKGKKIESYEPASPREHLNYDVYAIEPFPPYTVRCSRCVSIDTIKKFLKEHKKFTIVQDTTYKSDLWLLPYVGENIKPF